MFFGCNKIMVTCSSLILHHIFVQKVRLLGFISYVIQVGMSVLYLFRKCVFHPGKKKNHNYRQKELILDWDAKLMF